MNNQQWQYYNNIDGRTDNQHLHPNPSSLFPALDFAQYREQSEGASTSSHAFPRTDSISPRTYASHEFPVSPREHHRDAPSPASMGMSSPTSTMMTPSEAEGREQDLMGMRVDDTTINGFDHAIQFELQRERSHHSALSDSDPSILGLIPQGSTDDTSSMLQMQHMQFPAPIVQPQQQHFHQFDAQLAFDQHSNSGQPLGTQLTEPSSSPPWHPLVMGPAPPSMVYWELDSADCHLYRTSGLTEGSSAMGARPTHTRHTIYGGHNMQYPSPSPNVAGNELSSSRLPRQSQTYILNSRPNNNYMDDLEEISGMDMNYPNHHITASSSLSPLNGHANTLFNLQSAAPTIELAGSSLPRNANLHFIDEQGHNISGHSNGPPDMTQNQSQSNRAKRGKNNSSQGVRKQPAAHRSGGRKPGTHLKEQTAAHANKMRKVGGCWRCRLQRDKCDEGDTCGRCLNRQNKPGADFGLGCRREAFRDLIDVFRPVCMTRLHEPVELMNLADENIDAWYQVELDITLTSGKGLPWLPVKVYEFRPKTRELLRQFQYFKDPKTGESIKKEKYSLPLGMMGMNYSTDEAKYDSHVKQIIENFMPNLVKRYYAGEDNDFASRMFNLIVEINPSRNSEEYKLLAEVYHLIITTYILAHTFTLPEDSQDAYISKLRWNKNGRSPLADKTSPRLANRQLKHFFARLHAKAMLSLLNRLQSVLGCSKGSDQWSVAFIIVLGLAISFEVIQKYIHSILNSRFSSKEMTEFKADQEALASVSEMDRQFEFLMQVFKLKYLRTNGNPLRDCHIDWSEKVPSIGFRRCLQGLHNLVQEKSHYLQRKMQDGVSCKSWRRYTCRLTAKFLLSFYT